MKKINLTIMVMLLVLVSSVSLVYAQRGQHNKNAGQKGSNVVMDQLTEEQKAELQTLRAEMQASGATREEIRTAVAALFAEWGIEMPERPERGSRGDGDLLTEEQKVELQTLRAEMQAAGATREEIRTAVAALFAEWDIEMPERSERGSRGDGDLLTEEQKAELQTLRAEMQASGATREEIRTAVAALFAEWGIEMPERSKKDKGARGEKQTFWQLLSEEQKSELKAMIQEMKDSGATREEIRNAIKAQLEEWGITPPETTEESGKQKAKYNVSNRPNPFNPSTQIQYTVPETANVSVRIYNSKGQLVNELLNTTQSAGVYNITWYGDDVSGSSVSSGVYFYKLQIGSDLITDRMMLTR